MIFLATTMAKHPQIDVERNRAVVNADICQYATETTERDFTEVRKNMRPNVCLNKGVSANFQALGHTPLCRSHWNI